MKLIFASAVFAFVMASSALFAQDGTPSGKEPRFIPAVQAVPAEKTEEWDFLSFTFLPGVPPAADVFNVYGVKLGIPFGFADKAEVCGVEASILGSLTKRVDGVQASTFYNNAERVNGLQTTFGWNGTGTCAGLQLGLVNVAKDISFQIGLINVIEDSPLKVFPFVNVRFVK